MARRKLLRQRRCCKKSHTQHSLAGDSTGMREAYSSESRRRRKPLRTRELKNNLHRKLLLKLLARFINHNLLENHNSDADRRSRHTSHKFYLSQRKEKLFFSSSFEKKPHMSDGRNSFVLCLRREVLLNEQFRRK